MRNCDAMQNVLSETNALGHTTSWSFDNKRNKLTETNGLGDTGEFNFLAITEISIPLFNLKL
jgi:YD repeat-containing protein